METIKFIEGYVPNYQELFETLRTQVDWDESMSARKTASFGVAYNYSQMSYPEKEIPPFLTEIVERLKETVGFTANNCLINYYLDGKSKMGFHSDQTDILEDGTGIAIISLGETRTLRFRTLQTRKPAKDFDLPSGSLVYMTQELQREFQHSIPPSDTTQGRMSLTFRRMKTSSEPSTS